MANALYDKGREAFLTKQISWSADTIKAALVKNTYTPNLATHQFLSDLGANTVGTDQTLGSKTFTGGVAGAADATWTAVAAGATVTYVAIYMSTGVAGTSPLIALIDTSAAGAISITTNGSDILVQWDTGANKIFKL